MKGHFKDANENAALAEDLQIYKPKNYKKWTPNKNCQTVLTYIEATSEELEFKMQNQKPQPFDNIKGERTAVQE